MAAFVVVFLIFVLVMLGMAVGVICGRKPIAGSCGGISNLGMERACGCVDVCKNEEEQKQKMQDSETKNALTNSSAKLEIYRP